MAELNGLQMVVPNYFYKLGPDPPRRDFLCSDNVGKWWIHQGEANVQVC